MRKLLVVAIAATCLLLAGCGESGEATVTSTAATSTTSGPPPTTTTVETTGREPLPDSPPDATLASYFDHLNAGDTEAAWALLAPSVQDQLGGYDVWSSGISRRTSTVPTVTAAGGSERAPEFDVEQAVVDETPCGVPANRTFAGTWRLEPDGDGGWRIAAVEQTLVSGPPDLETICASSGY